MMARRESNRVILLSATSAVAERRHGFVPPKAQAGSLSDGGDRMEAIASDLKHGVLHILSLPSATCLPARRSRHNVR
jgi:hypothetical protein